MRKNISVTLPSEAKEFLKAIETQLRPGTLSHYQHSLRSFHFFLNQEQIKLSNVKHSHIQSFSLDLKKHGLTNASRSQILLNIRCYISWLYEQGALLVAPSLIITAKDLPKLPLYLPRPLPANIDNELQTRLSKSDDVYHQALLLMRLTGLRAKETLQLVFHCILEDHIGSTLLKVPLGKLNNERMVPIDPKTVELIRSIQKQTLKTIKNPIFLFCTKHGKNIVYPQLRVALKNISYDLKTDKPIVSHRLRHSYASSLLNAGMSLVGIMRLLGHRDFRMTLRYSAVTQETVKKEYFSALAKIQTRCLPNNPLFCPENTPRPEQLLSQLISLMKKNDSQNQTHPCKERLLLIKRIQRLRSDLTRAGI